MIAPKHAPATAAARIVASQLRVIVPPILIARRLLMSYLRSGWIVLELAYVLALYLFAFREPFEPSFFFETASWGLGVLAICASLLLVSRAMRPGAYQTAIEKVSRRAYVAGLALALAMLRVLAYALLLALTLLSGHLLNATPGALLAGSIGLLAICSVLATLALTLSSAFAPRLARLIFLGWLTGALYSYVATGTMAALFFAWRLPLLPVFACFEIGMTGTIDGGGLLALTVDAVYVVGLVALADYWLRRRETARSAARTDGAEPALAVAAPVESVGEPAASAVPSQLAGDHARQAQPSRSGKREGQRRPAKDQAVGTTAPSRARAMNRRPAQASSRPAPAGRKRSPNRKRSAR